MKLQTLFGARHLPDRSGAHYSRTTLLHERHSNYSMRFFLKFPVTSKDGTYTIYTCAPVSLTPPPRVLYTGDSVYVRACARARGVCAHFRNAIFREPVGRPHGSIPTHFSCVPPPPLPSVPAFFVPPFRPPSLRLHLARLRRRRSCPFFLGTATKAKPGPAKFARSPGPLLKGETSPNGGGSLAVLTSPRSPNKRTLDYSRNFFFACSFFCNGERRDRAFFRRPLSSPWSVLENTPTDFKSGKEIICSLLLTHLGRLRI